MEPAQSEVVEVLSPWEPTLLSIALYTFFVVALMVVILFLTRWLGVKKENPDKLLPYEGGIIPSGWAQYHYPVPFYLVAVFFLIFDVEAAFIFSWAVAFDRLGWMGWFDITFFIFILLVSLVYLWLKGGLEWGTTARTAEKSMRARP